MARSAQGPVFARRNYSGYLLLDRAKLLADVADAGHPPAFARVVAEHVTFAYPDPSPAPQARSLAVVGHAALDGVQALVVSLDGQLWRPDGRLFHLTYSLAHGRRPVESNAMLAAAWADGAIEDVDPIPVEFRRF